MQTNPPIRFPLSGRAATPALRTAQRSSAAFNDQTARPEADTIAAMKTQVGDGVIAVSVAAHHQQHLQKKRGGERHRAPELHVPSFRPRETHLPSTDVVDSTSPGAAIIPTGIYIP